ncbi:hypothetical protein MesoLj113a_24070 [Mesorhizobium sp. 113-1-2]|nr:hypothetical protein MesoLj113a_24070 [Mesorhizobium sp. 113-1-2]
MALDITTQDIIIDETTGLQDDDVNSSVPPHNNATVQYLLGLDAAGGLPSPEVAFQSNFVVASANAGETITSVVLTQSASGTPFSTTVGVNSGIQTVDGNYVWLFQDATHANVVIGVIGTSDPLAEPAETGPLAFSLGLINTSATNADLYTVEYVPLLHPDTTNPDDRINLADKVFASVTGTSVNNFLGSAAAPGNHDFYLINSANDASKQLLVIGLNGATANVSTQGFGVDNQSINPNETLQVDFVTGGNLNAGTAAQIQYGAHIETISQAGFTINQITPSTPTARVDISISAFNNTGNEQGTDFFDGTATSSVDITSIKLTGTSGFASVITADGTYATGAGNVTITGLTGSGNTVTITGLDNVTTVDVTTASPMDRLQVKGVDANEGCDISEFHFSSTSTNAYSEEVGSHINFDDDGPTISTTGTEPTLTVDETVLATNDTQSFAANFSSAFGADGAGTLTYALGFNAGSTGIVDTLTGEAVVLSLNGGVVEGRTATTNALVFTVSVSAAGNVTLDQLRAVVHPTADPDESKTLTADNLVQLTATITDKDGDHRSATLNIGQNLIFKDDGPTISTTGTEPTLTVDETVLATNDTQSFAANFSSAFGADGAGTLTYALGFNAGSTGIVDTLTGEAVVLSLNGGVVEGRTATTNALVFTVSVSAAGSVTLDQIRAVVHPTAAPDESKTLTADNLVQLTATITDKDGDHQSATLNIGQNLIFKDDGPTISTTGTEPTLTVDETVLATNDTQSFAANFSSAFGADGAGTLTYALGFDAGSTGIVDTLTGEAVVLSLNGGVVEGRTATTNALVFTVSVSAAGSVTLDQLRAVVHPTADPDESKTLTADNLVQLTATITDKDGDHQSATLNIGQNLIFKDDGPSISTTGTEPTLTVDESALGPDATQSFAANFSSAFGADGAGTLTYALGFNAGATGIVDTLTGEAVVLSLNGLVLEGRTATTNLLVFTVSVDATGSATLDQIRSVVHANPNDPDDSKTLNADNLVQLTATITDKDGDHRSATLDIGTNLVFKDDGPTITVPFDGDQSGAPGTHETLANTLNASATGAFGYDIGADSHPASFYNATHSDFVDANANLAGIQIDLTGTISGGGGGNILNPVVTLASESALSATFNFSFTYDKDPAPNVQTGTAAGTLVFDKVADTYTIQLTDPLEGFSFDVLHTNELLAKAPTGNTGHPLIVAEQLTPNADPDPFFVQFTANSITNSIGFGFNSTGDGAVAGGNTPDTAFTPNAHDMITNLHEDWVSATQATNGVAGDTIQKGEALTLRFFTENILPDVNPQAPDGGTERIDPTAKASGVVIKFDGIGNSEDLILILDLKDANGNEITRAVNVQNSDLIKGNANVPSPYSTEFTLDNNDALLIVEQNDYTVTGETYQIQGIQIMQSANGLTGNAINLNGAIGVNGGSSATTNLTTWDPTDNDVLKIVDIGFVQQSSGTVDAHLDFAFKVADADLDQTVPQHILVDVA